MIPVFSTELVYLRFGGPSHNAHNRGVASLELRMKMNAGQLEVVDTIHVFLQQAFLEEFLPFALPMACKKFKITLRYSDWWFWDSDVNSEDKLGICPWRSGTTSFEEMQDEPRKQHLRQKCVVLFYRHMSGGCHVCGETQAYSYSQMGRDTSKQRAS